MHSNRFVAITRKKVSIYPTTYHEKKKDLPEIMTNKMLAPEQQMTEKATIRISSGNKSQVNVLLNHSLVLRAHDSIVPTIIKNEITITGIVKTSPCQDLRPYLSILSLILFSILANCNIENVIYSE